MKKKATRPAAGNFTKIGTWSGIPVHVDTNGHFYAKVDDIEIQADRLETVRTKIDAALKPSAKKAPISLPVIAILDNEKIVTATITGISRANRSLQFDPSLPKHVGRYNRQVLADTSANRELAEAYIEAAAAAAKTRDAVQSRNIEIRGYGRIEIEQYEGVAASVIADHKKSAK